MRRGLLIGSLALLGVVLALAGVLVVRTLRLGPPAGAGASPGLPAAPDLEAVERLAGAVRIPTVSRARGEVAQEAFRHLHRYLEERFPRVHQALDHQEVGGWSLLYVWPGADPAAAPLLLLAHQDVVPIDPGSRERWTHPPFSGAVSDGYVWGRGSMDDKGSLVAILEAVEGLLADGHRPRRTVILAFGHDEELGGEEGAARIARLLASRGVHPALVLDEGMAVVDGSMLGTGRPVALVGVAEKGYLSVQLVAGGEGGHSSTPPRETAVDVLARAVERLRAHPMPAAIDGPVAGLFRAVAPELPFGRRLVTANLWLFEPLVVRTLEAEPATDAMLRTTTAPTLLRAGVKDNVLPTEARAVVNFRIHPRDSTGKVLEHVRRTVADPRVEVAPYGDFASEPSAVSPVGGAAYELVARSLTDVMPEALVAPDLVLGGTDSRHYAELSGELYRFVPFSIGPGDLERVHGTDERLAIADYARMVAFYRRLITAADAPGALP